MAGSNLYPWSFSLKIWRFPLGRMISKLPFKFRKVFFEKGGMRISVEPGESFWVVSKHDEEFARSQNALPVPKLFRFLYARYFLKRNWYGYPNGFLLFFEELDPFTSPLRPVSGLKSFIPFNETSVSIESVSGTFNPRTDPLFRVHYERAGGVSSEEKLH